MTFLGFPSCRAPPSCPPGRDIARLRRESAGWDDLGKRHNVVCRCRNRDLSPKNIEQHPDPSGIVQTIEDCELLGERPRHQPHRSAYLQFVAEMQNAARVGCRDKRLDHLARNRMRLIAPHHQPRYPKSAVDAAPLMAGEIEHDEQIAGEKWRLDSYRFARMPDGLAPFRLKRPESLAMQLNLGTRFGKRQVCTAYQRSQSESAPGRLGTASSRGCARPGITIVAPIQSASVKDRSEAGRVNR